MDGSETSIVYAFGPFRLDSRARELRRGAATVRLSAKAFDTLLVLVANAGEIQSRETLIDTVWGNIAVEDNNLTQQISALRKILGNERFIVTVPGRGYCFVGEVKRTDRNDAHRSAKRVPRFGFLDREGLLGYALAIVFTLVVCFPVIFDLAVASGRPHSLAVLQFRSSLGDEFIGTGISDTLRARLGSVEDLVVRPGSLRDDQDIVAAGRELNVDAVVSGSVQRVDGRVRITVEMVDVGNGRIVWGRAFDDDLSDVFALQDSIAAAVADVLRVKLTATSRIAATARA